MNHSRTHQQVRGCQTTNERFQDYATKFVRLKHRDRERERKRERERERETKRWTRVSETKRPKEREREIESYKKTKRQRVKKTYRLRD